MTPLETSQIVAAIDGGDIVAVVVFLPIIVGLLYGQTMFQAGSSFKRHLVKLAIIGAVVLFAMLAIGLLR